MPYSTAVPHRIYKVRHAEDFGNAIVFNEIPTEEDIITCTKDEEGRKKTVILDFDELFVLGIHYSNGQFFLVHFHSQKNPYSYHLIYLKSQTYETVVEKIISMVEEEIVLRQNSLVKFKVIKESYIKYLFNKKILC